jgi:hypothetical protein
MDQYDSVLCLDYLLNSGDYRKKIDGATLNECKNKLELCKMTLASSKESRSALSEEERGLMREQIAYVEEHLKIKTADMYHAAAQSGVLPKSFYLNHCLGAVPYEQVHQATSFQIRGKSYCADNKKVSFENGKFCSP